MNQVLLLLALKVSHMGKNSMAEKLGVSYATILRWIHGETPVPDRVIIDLYRIIQSEQPEFTKIKLPGFLSEDCIEGIYRLICLDIKAMLQNASTTFYPKHDVHFDYRDILVHLCRIFLPLRDEVGADINAKNAERRELLLRLPGTNRTR